MSPIENLPFTPTSLVISPKRYYPPIQRLYQRKASQPKRGSAIKAVAHKVARACHDVRRDQGPFDREKACTYAAGQRGWAGRVSREREWQNQQA
jgi:hypothetical protein